MPTSNDHRSARHPRAEDAAADAARLLLRLAAQLAQLRQTLAAQPWHAPALKEISRIIECACRAAFTDREVWRWLWRGDTTLPPPPCPLRCGGLVRAMRLLDRAESRLAQLPPD